MNGFLLRAATVGVLGFLAVTQAPAPVSAALVTCPEPGFTQEPNAKVENSTGLLSATVAGKCQYVVPPDPSNVNTVANINAAGFFGDTHWLSNGVANTQVAGGATGTWSIANPTFAQFAYAIVFKDGSDTNLIAFVLNELFTSGVWTTPFTDPPFSLSGGSTSHDVSDWTIVRTLLSDCPGCGITPVIVDAPEPASMAVLGMGLLGLAAARRRSAST